MGLPEELRWEPGFFTRVTTNGIWLLVEDADRFPQILVILLADL